MPLFRYIPDLEQKIHPEGAIRQLCQPFLSHENGLPEWIKNSAAAYIREGREPQKRVIILMFSSKHRSNPASIACLDFVGMSSTQIERDFRHWADPEAAIRENVTNSRIGELGGHGNGGKCYMTQMFEEYASFVTVKEGLKCQYGVKGGSVAFGYIPNRETGRNFSVTNILNEIDNCLHSMRLSVDSLPASIIQLASESTGFTFIQGVGPRFFDERSAIQRLINDISSHHQMITPLQVCSIYVINNGSFFNNSKPLTLPQIVPFPGYEIPKEYIIPKILRDPISNQQISTTDNNTFPVGKLLIFTSKKNMRYGRDTKKLRHTVTYNTTQSGVIGKIPMQQLDVNSSFRDHLYCECYLDSLDFYQQNNRGQLSESPMTRSVEEWISSQVRNLCRELEEIERKSLREQDKSEISRINDFLDHWKNQLLQDYMQGLYGGEGGDRPIRPSQNLPTGIPRKIEISISHPYSGKGVYFRPSIKFLDSKNHQIRPVPYRWVSEDNNVALIDEELMLIQTFAFGVTRIYAETLDKEIKSNIIPLEVIRIQGIRITPHEIEMPAGTRKKFEALCKLPDGSEISNVHLTWVEGNSSIARVSSSGLVYAFSPGKTEVTALDESCRSDVPANIVVKPSPGRGEGNESGRGFPRILISEIDCAPNEDRPQFFRSDEPPVCQRVQDIENNIWWINLASPFARYFYMSRIFGVTSIPWRIYHVERVIDIIVQVALANGPGSEESKSSREWIQSSSEIEADIRQKALDSLKLFIEEGETE